MTPKDYEYLLVAADLAHVDKRWGFSIKMMKWRLFLEGHRFTTINCDCTFEVDVKKVDLNAFIEGESPKHKEKVNFIRIGVLHAKSPRKIEMQKDSGGLMIVTPPQLNGLWIKHQSFRQSVEQSKWNYLLEKEEEDHKDEDNSEDDEDDSHHHAFHRRSVAVRPSIALALAPSIACSRRAVRRRRWTIMPCQLVVVSSLVVLSCWN
jgi:hypothetical protein